MVIAAAGGPPGDLLKVWDATGGRHCHLEFGFSCMGYEIPAALGVRLADAEPGTRVVSFLGDGTFLLAPTELVTAAQEGLAVTLVVPDNRGYQVIHRLQMLRSGREFGNEFRYRPEPLHLAAGARAEGARGQRAASAAAGGGLPQPRPGAGRGRARCPRMPRHHSGRTAGISLSATRGYPGPVVIVVPVIPHADLPGAGVGGRGPGGGVHSGRHGRPARRVRKRQQGAEVVRVNALASPLNHGALAVAVRSGTPTLGTFIGSASPIAAEVCAAAGVDWVLLDLEHGAGGEEQVRDVVPAAGSYGVPTVVRVESAARIRMGGCWTAGPRASCCPG